MAGIQSKPRGAKEAGMALSDDEQRALDDIERALYADDPRFASRITGVDRSSARRPP